MAAGDTASCKVAIALAPRRQKSRNRNARPASQRRPDIRAYVDHYIQSLIDLYEGTDPAKGEASEEDKLERARQAISIWWHLFGELLLWAQSHLAGYEIGRANSQSMEKLAKILGHEISVDSHVLEYIGFLFSANRVNYDDPMADKVERWREKHDVELDTASLRYLIRELLMSRSATSSFWRLELQAGLYALNLGHVEEIFEPESTRRQGNPIQLLRWKVRALQHVYFHLGKGLRKYRALHLVADGLGQSVETLRSWEKFISGDDDLRIEVRSAKLAGELESELDKHSISELIKSYGAEYHRHTADLEYAKQILGFIRSTPLKEIRDGLRSGRMVKQSGS
jgi:hypothetical protein